MKKQIAAIIFEKNQNHDGITLRSCSGADHPPRNSVAPSPEIESIATYSPRKNSANLKPEYSVKYPATSSDSPSGRSNGDLFVSAVAAIANNTNAAKPIGVNTNQCGKPQVYWFCISTILSSESDPVIITITTLDIRSGTS